MVRRLLCLFLVMLALGTARGVLAEQRAKYVIIISIDGGKPAVILQSQMPTLIRLTQYGSYTWEAQTISPSITLPSHTSMITGVGPEKHKVNWNDWRPKRGIISSPTALFIAHQKGLHTAMFAGKEKFKHLWQVGSLDYAEIPAYEAIKVATHAAKYIIEHKPNLCFIHFSDPDGAGHKNGWGSPQQIQAFANCDAALKLILNALKTAGIAEESVIMVSADHGGHAKTHGTKMPEDMNIPWVVWGGNAKQGFRITEPVTTYDTAATALWLLDIPIPSNWDGKPVKSAFP